MIHRFSRLLTIGGIATLIMLAVRPHHDGALRYGLPLALFAVWSVGLRIVWQRKFWRSIVLILPLLAAAPFCLPEVPMNPERLRTRYVAAMERMEGSRYVWGGESHHGIDCSGLPRRGLRDALLETGMESLDGASFREWARLWWFDTSAKALAENYRGFTRPLGLSGKLRDLDVKRFSPGDLAVTGDGRHVMVYLRDGKWIQADPHASEVTVSKPAEDRNPWFDSFVTMHRWTAFD